MRRMLQEAWEGKYARIEGFADYHIAHPGEYNPLEVLAAQYELLNEGIVPDIQLFGSAGTT